MNASLNDERDRNRYTGYQEAWDAEATADSGPQRWLDAEGNTDWDAHAQHADELRDAELADRESCATCDGGGCGDCV